MNLRGLQILGGLDGSRARATRLGFLGRIQPGFRTKFILLETFVDVGVRFSRSDQITGCVFGCGRELRLLVET